MPRQSGESSTVGASLNKALSACCFSTGTVANSVELKLVLTRLDHVVGQVDEKLGEAALGGSVVAENGRKGCIAERLREALTKSFTGARVVTQTVNI